VGVNQGKFDPLYTVDTMIDYDMATLVRSIYARSGGKPSVLVGHSMGGLVAENMMLNWSLARRLNTLEGLRPEQKDLLGQALPQPEAAGQYLKMVKALSRWPHRNFSPRNPISSFPPRCGSIISPGYFASSRFRSRKSQKF
jgi:pimeloyl-ACP methyl ester carboxylesterase